MSHLVTYLPVDCYSIGVRIMSPSDISTCRLLFHRSQDNPSDYLSIVIPSESG